MKRVLSTYNVGGMVMTFAQARKLFPQVNERLLHRRLRHGVSDLEALSAAPRPKSASCRGLEQVIITGDPLRLWSAPGPAQLKASL